ncbi:MAG: nucleoside triphosphate pyrophosphohydrolase, partial [Clostridia bacterium]|nr:nucleoside triphosphate pyrophosphohydrolase [Clostridia bacterium]
MKITLVGLGTGSDTVTLRGLKAIKNADRVICRTALTKSAELFKNEGIEVEFLDYIFENSRNFDSLNKKLAKAVIDAAKNSSSVAYCVDGSVFSDNSCAIILKKFKGAEVIEGVSRAENALSVTTCRGGFTAISAYSPELFTPSCVRPLVIYDVDSAFIASEWKLRLTDALGDEVDAVLYSGGSSKKIKLYQLDNFSNYDYSTAVVVYGEHFTKKQRFAADDLFAIVEALRVENGCPWDREQTRLTIKQNLIEESYELYDAIVKGDTDAICEEIGDVLLQVAFHCIFGEENHEYSRNDVISGICSKLIFRHTHVFGNDKAKSGKEALDVWDKNKSKEKGYANGSEYLKSVPESFPALMRAQKVQKRAGKYNFDFSSVEQVIEKVKEEMGEVNTARATMNASEISGEVGDLLFSVVNLARFLKVDAEEALNNSTKKFLS